MDLLYSSQLPPPNSRIDAAWVVHMDMLLSFSRNAGWMCLLIGLSLFHAFGQAPNKPARDPLPEMWAKLQARIDSANAKAGDAVTARVSQDWSYKDCVVPSGAILDGRVAEVSAWSDASKVNKVSLSFSATCGGSASIPIILIAVFYPVDDGKSQMEIYTSLPMGIGPGASGRQSTNLDAMPSSGIPPEPLPLAKLGEVKRIKNLSLAVGKGIQQSSVLSSTTKRLRLEPGTRLAFIPVPDRHEALTR